MVIYDLVCENNHGFEGWFKDAQDYAAQLGSGLISCPACDSAEVKRKLSSINIGSPKSTNKDNHTQKSIVTSDDSVTKQDESHADLPLRFTTTAEQAEVIRGFVEKNFEDVGSDFSEEVRKIHYGESTERGIRGHATAEEVADLEEEGIQTFALPAKSST